MTPDLVRAMYRRQIERHGEDVILRRVNASPAAPTDLTVRARVKGFSPDELAGGIQQGDRQVILLAEDVEAAGFPVPLQTGGTDKVVVRSRALNIQAVDDSTARIGDTLIAYLLTVRG